MLARVRTYCQDVLATKLAESSAKRVAIPDTLPYNVFYWSTFYLTDDIMVLPLLARYAKGEN